MDKNEQREIAGEEIAKGIFEAHVRSKVHIAYFPFYYLCYHLLCSDIRLYQLELNRAP